MWKEFQKSSSILIDAKIILFDSILNMCIVTASNRSLFWEINLFHKYGARYLNLNFAKFFLHNSLSNEFLDLAVYLLIVFRV